MIYIESFSNPRYKWLKGLAKSRNRRKEKVFLMEGRVEMELALRVGQVPTQIYFTSTYVSEEEIQNLLSGRTVDLVELSKALFDSLAYQQVPGNFIAVFPSFETQPRSTDGLVVVLEGIEKPGNLGAVLRTCDALGIQQVITTNAQVDLFNPNVIRNSRGAIFTVGCSSMTNEEALSFLKGEGRTLLAAALSDGAVNYREIAQNSKYALVMGAESAGLTDFWLDQCDKHIIIPIKGAVDSLNVSVSFAILASYFVESAKD